MARNDETHESSDTSKIFKRIMQLSKVAVSQQCDINSGSVNALQTISFSYSTVSSNVEKLSYYHHIGKDPLVYRTFSEHFEISAAKYGNREAIVSCYEGKRYTYTEALEKVFVLD